MARTPYRLMGPASRAKRRASNYKSAQKYKNRRRADKLKSRFGLTPEQYEQMLVEQSGVCAICHHPETSKNPQVPGTVKRLMVDHNHTTRQVRGLLCTKCNGALGFLDEDVLRFFAAVSYLQKHTS